MSRRTDKRMKRAAAKAPAWLRTGSAAKADFAEQRKHKTRKLGQFGAASEVRHIDPSEYEVQQ